MLGYDMSWASFHVVEVMSSPRAHLKSVGYLGAIQSFTEDTDVLMLTTNLLKKVGRLASPDPCKFMRFLGFELHAHRCRHYAQWTLAHRHSRPCPGSSTRTDRHAEPLKITYPETRDTGVVQALDEIPRGYSSSSFETGRETGRFRSE